MTSAHFLPYSHHLTIFFIKKNRWGIFRLTDPPGLPHILNCTHTDTFHPHSVDNIYTDAGHPPGHVYETSRMDFYVHDLRPKK